MENFVRNRITQLRLSKGLSEYQLSYSLGHSRGYIYNISSGKSLPSMSEFFAICEFFNTEHCHPEFFSKALDGIQDLNDDDILIILTLINRLKKDNSN